MPVSLLTCAKCGGRYHPSSPCPCSSRRSRSSGGGGGLSSRIAFLLGWPLAMLVVAVIVFGTIWWAGTEFGRFRGGLAALGVYTVVVLFGYGLLVENWMDGEGGWDPFNNFF